MTWPTLARVRARSLRQSSPPLRQTRVHLRLADAKQRGREATGVSSHSLASPCATRPARPTGKTRDTREEGDSLDKVAVKRVRSYLTKLKKIKEVKAVIEELTGSKLGDDFCAASDATLKSCIAGHVPWRPLGDSEEMGGDALGTEGNGKTPPRPHALRQAEIRLYCSYQR